MPFWNNKAEIEDKEIRSYVAKNCKDGVDPRSALGDWGDHEEDHDDRKHDQSNSRAKNRDSSGVGAPTPEETAEFYDNGRPEDIKPKKGWW